MITKIGIYPGTFDPITNGHLDIIARGLKVVDKLYIAVAESSTKHTLFSALERVELIQNSIQEISSIDLSRVEVVSFSGLLVKYAANIGASIIIRGIRVVSDFEYEFQLSCMNSKLDSNFQTIFLPASEHMQLISSKIVKEVAKLGGDISDFVTPHTKRKMIDAYGKLAKI
jgi:pantetheine-phosphate adenylyltransferase